VYVEIASV
jgi:hypothetical protein